MFLKARTARRMNRRLVSELSDRERLQLREQPLLELLQAGKIQSLEPRFELLP